MMPKSIEVILNTSTTQTKAGELVDVLAVELVAPSVAQLTKTYKLQQIMTRALLSSKSFIEAMQNNNSDANEDANEDDTITARKLKILLLTADVDINLCLSEFDKLAFNKAVLIDGEGINKIQWAKIQDDDKERIMLEYLANFILALVLEALNGN